MISKMEREKKNGQMAHLTKALINMVLSMEWGNLLGQMEAVTQGNL